MAGLKDGETVYFIHDKDYAVGVIDKHLSCGIVNIKHCFILNDNGDKIGSFGNDLMFENKCFCNLEALKNYLELEMEENIEKYFYRIHSVEDLLKFPLSYILPMDDSYERDAMIEAYKKKCQQMLNVEV